MSNTQLNMLVCLVQVASNGVLSVSGNHCPGVEEEREKISSKKLLGSEKKHLLHEFNDDQVIICLKCEYNLHPEAQSNNVSHIASSF